MPRRRANYPHRSRRAKRSPRQERHGAVQQEYREQETATVNNLHRMHHHQRDYTTRPPQGRQQPEQYKQNKNSLRRDNAAPAHGKHASRPMPPHQRIACKKRKPRQHGKHQLHLEDKRRHQDRYEQKKCTKLQKHRETNLDKNGELNEDKKNVHNAHLKIIDIST